MTSCKKDTASSLYMNTIQITGYNQTVPPCAPVFNATWSDGPNAGTYVSISNTGPQLGLTNTTTFPVTMKINWVAHTPTCSGDITITSYQIQ